MKSKSWPIVDNIGYWEKGYKEATTCGSKVVPELRVLRVRGFAHIFDATDVLAPGQQGRSSESSEFNQHPTHKAWWNDMQLDVPRYREIQTSMLTWQPTRQF